MSLSVMKCKRGVFHSKTFLNRRDYMPVLESVIETKKPALAEITGVDDYLSHFGPDLANKLIRESKPLYDPTKDKWHPRLHNLLRTPFQAQGDTIMGLVKCLENLRGAFVIGEMGVGKTLIGAAVPYIFSKKPCRSLIMCPGHLVLKWIREIENTVPDAKAQAIRSFKEMIPLRDKRGTQPKNYEYYVISRDRSKLSYFWKPAFVKKEKLIACPSCFEQLLDKDNVPITEAWFSRKRNCPNCNNPLWQADNKRCGRFAPSDEFVFQVIVSFFQNLSQIHCSRQQLWNNVVSL